MAPRTGGQILLCTLLFAAARAEYAFTTTEKFKVNVVLIPDKSQETQGLMSRFGGLASFARISLGSDDQTEPLAVVRTKSPAREIVRERDLVQVLLVGKCPEFQ